MLDRVSVADRLTDIVRGHAPYLPSDPVAAVGANLADAGLTSMAAVRLMLSLEAAFAIAIPDAELTPENFATIAAMQKLVDRLLAA
jgi:acyl carrier protein